MAWCKSGGVIALSGGLAGFYQASHGGQPDERVLAQGRDGFQRHVARPLHRPFIVLLQQDGADQAIAQYWERVGVRTRVDAMPSTVFFPRQAQRAFSAAPTGWQSSLHQPNNIVAPVLLTEDRAWGWGTVNRFGYSNPRVDELYTRAVVSMDRQDRIRLWREAMRVAMEDAAVLPIHHQVNIRATRRGLAYEPRSDGYTLPMSLAPAP